MEDVLETAAALSEEELEEILVELEAFDGRYPKDAIAKVRQHQTAMIPLLIRAIEEAIVEVQKTDNVEGSAAFLGLALLGEFRAKEALPVILQAISLPDEMPFEIFGDAVHEILPRVLADLSDSTDVFDRLIADQNVNQYVRSSAGRAYLESVYLGRVTRAEAVGKLQIQLRAALDSDDRRVINWLVMNLADYGPVEAMDEIREAFRENLVERFLIRLEDFDEILTRDELSEQLERIAKLRQRQPVDQLESWCWQRDEDEQHPDYRNALHPPVMKPAPWTDEDFSDEDFDDEDFVDDEEFGYEPLPSVGTIRYTEARVGRNEPCPCGSGKKFKKCCGGASE